MLDTSLNGIAPLSSVLLVLVIIALVLRFYARHAQKANLQVDDWLMIPAFITFVGLASLSFYGMSKKFVGYKEPHNLELVGEVAVVMAKTYIGLDVISVLTLGLAKLSALFFYRRIFCSSIGGSFSIITIITIVVVILWTITFIVMTGLTCGPNIDALWAGTPASKAKCWLIVPYFMGTTISDFIIDVFIICLPIPKIWSLHTTNRRKIAISGVFLLALVGVGASCARMVVTIHLAAVGKPVDDEDSYQSNTAWAYYVILEAGLTIIAVNLPSLWYFLAGVTPERVLRSVRSIISLGSNRGSQGSHKSGEAATKKSVENAPTREKSMDTNSSNTHLAREGAETLLYPRGKSVESYTMTDLAPFNNETISSADGGIRVNHTFQRTEERV